MTSAGSAATGGDAPLRFADSHCHLADAAFADDADAVVARARDAGVARIIVIGEAARPERAHDVAVRHGDIAWWTCGVHPHEAAAIPLAQAIEATRSALARGACAIGECGLDYFYDHAPRPLQRTVFEAQLALAADSGRPVVVHSRNAADDTAAMIRAAGPAVRGVLHCHTGPIELAMVALEHGWSCSFAGVVTFKSWTDDALIRAIPEDRLLVESDSPYLAPVPDRGKRNEPAWVARTLRAVAAVRGDDVSRLGAVVLANTERLFGVSVG
ncbi:MAG: TatD family hydrolase [Gemmatimonadaceae bacterium]|nr:TatD family hydrolase [Gemmatimonadaceae bacterium]